MLRKLNSTLETFQPIINTLGMLLTIIGILFTFLQVQQTNRDLTRNIYQFNGEQYPTIKFEIIDKELGLFKTNILQPDMLFQFTRVSYHDSLLGEHQEAIRMHDSIWYNSLLFSKIKADSSLNVEIKELMKDNDFHSYVNVRTPVLLEINYVKYGESRTIPGLFELEFSYFKDFHNSGKDFESEVRAVYFKEYLNPESEYKKKLQELGKFTVINGA